jgi:hypothetical protein
LLLKNWLRINNTGIFVALKAQNMLKFINDHPDIIAILLSPLLAWIVTILYQNRAEKRKAKRDLFLIIMAKRRTTPPAIELVDALNKIDVVFQNNPKVRAAWREYFLSLHQENWQFENSNSFLLDLLSEMASVLGYKHLRQTEIDRVYSPRYYSDIRHGQQLLFDEQFRVLRHSKNTAEGFSDEEMEKRNNQKG